MYPNKSMNKKEKKKKSHSTKIKKIYLPAHLKKFICLGDFRNYLCQIEYFSFVFKQKLFSVKIRKLSYQI